MTVPTQKTKDLEHAPLVKAGTFQNAADASLAQSVLDSAGIESFLADENTNRLFGSTPVSRTKLLVNAADADSALALLDEVRMHPLTEAEVLAQEQADAGSEKG